MFSQAQLITIRRAVEVLGKKWGEPITTEYTNGIIEIIDNEIIELVFKHFEKNKIDCSDIKIDFFSEDTTNILIDTASIPPVKTIIVNFDETNKPMNIIEWTNMVNNKFNTTQVEMLQGDLQATLAFRKTLFGASSSSNGYRYKVQCSVTEEVKKSYDALSAFCSNLDSKDFKANENWNKIGKGAKMSYWNTFSMYFNEEQDIMMLKLILGGSDLKILKAVLYSEIDDKVLE